MPPNQPSQDSTENTKSHATSMSLNPFQQQDTRQQTLPLMPSHTPAIHALSMPHENPQTVESDVVDTHQTGSITNEEDNGDKEDNGDEEDSDDEEDTRDEEELTHLSHTKIPEILSDWTMYDPRMSTHSRRSRRPTCPICPKKIIIEDPVISYSSDGKTLAERVGSRSYVKSTGALITLDQIRRIWEKAKAEDLLRPGENFIVPDEWWRPNAEQQETNPPAETEQGLANSER